MIYDTLSFTSDIPPLAMIASTERQRPLNYPCSVHAEIRVPPRWQPGNEMRQLMVKIATVFFMLGISLAAQSADRAEITFADGRIFPESVTHTKDGTLYFGSMGLDSVYRATPKSAKAEVWIQPKSNGLQTVTGVFADEGTGTLWVCASASGGRGGAPVVGETALKAFNLKTAAFKASYAFPGNGLCNDVAIARDGTLYVTDTTGARVLRLKKGATTLDVWASDKELLTTADGVAVLGDGAVYVNSVGQGFLVRIPVKADGSAGPITKLASSKPLQQPDGMRSIGKNTILLVEGAGRLDEVTINGDKAEIKVIKEGLTGSTAVTLVNGMAYVTEARLNLRSDPSKDPGPFRAVGVPYKAPK
jgi:sugar lactone lactonase YvrE